jgi:DHA2 family multidrug resistance protein
MIVAFTVAAILGFILFLWRELTFKYPIVELRVLKNSNERIGTMMSFVLDSDFMVPLLLFLCIRRVSWDGRPFNREH